MGFRRTSGNRHPSFRERLQMEADRALGRIFPSDVDGKELGDSTTAWVPPVDVLETDRVFRLRVDLPGVRREHVSIHVGTKQFTVQGDRMEGAKGASDVVILGGNSGQVFYRTLILPSEVDPDRATAHLHSGVLLVDLPKAKKRNGTDISVR